MIYREFASATNEKLVYTRFSDFLPVVRKSYEYCKSRKPSWSGKIITTLSAGWPAVFFTWGGTKSFIAIDRNQLQFKNLFRKYPAGSCAELTDYLYAEDAHYCAIDITQTSDSFWDGCVLGDEIVFLSNIIDHVVSEDRLQMFIDCLIAMLSSSANAVNIDFIVTTMNDANVGLMVKLLDAKLAGTGLRLTTTKIETSEFPNSYLLSDCWCLSVSANNC